jgi:hypothetical protein
VRIGGAPSYFGIGPVDDRVPEPRVAGSGPVVCSSSRELESWPSVVWDVNGYYHALGVGFRATRKQLLNAYNQLNGQDDDYLTYVFKQLLTPGIRRAYDATPLGAIFIDHYVETKLKRMAQEQAQRLRRVFGERAKTAEQILADMGFVIDNGDLDDACQPDGDAPENPVEDGVDIPQEAQEDVHIGSKPQAAKWPYTYYVWKLTYTQRYGSDHAPVMQEWQEMISAACHQRGATVRFAVGLMGGGRAWDVMSVEGDKVAFISIESIGRMHELAHHAALRLITLKI